MKTEDEPSASGTTHFHGPVLKISTTEAEQETSGHGTAPYEVPIQETQGGQSGGAENVTKPLTSQSRHY